jgi:hypothetical protein
MHFTRPSNSLAHYKARRETAHADPYHESGKHAGNLICSQCHVVYTAGRWHWNAPAAGSVATLCPACRRVRDRHAAHVIRVEGVPGDQRAELVNMVFRIAEIEREEHALERLMLVREDGASIEVATTGVHIARRLIANLLRRWRYELHVRHGSEHTRMTWRRER